jgi:hypothetical protein
VTFTIAAAAWGGRDDRRPQWLMLKHGVTQLWPTTARDERNPLQRLNIGMFYGYRFGRLNVR